jgi:hypothetical protein
LRNWKAKALTRRQANKVLKKRIMELTRSRDAWKMKAQAYQRRLTEGQAHLTPEKKLPRPL